MSAATQIQHIAEWIDEPQQMQVLEYMKKLLPDNIATAEDLMDIAIARTELSKGEAVDFNSVDWS